LRVSPFCSSTASSAGQRAAEVLATTLAQYWVAVMGQAEPGQA
jgi:hypothetical protein